MVDKAECCSVSCLPIEWERICVIGCVAHAFPLFGFKTLIIG